MSTHTIYHCLEIKAPLEQVRAALTKRAGLQGWWTANVEHNGALGSVSTFRFSSGAFNRMRIETVEPNLVEWECVDGHEEWIGTRVQFRLRPEGEVVQVCFSHHGWRELTQYVGECSFHWAYYMMSLRSFCETGRGTPNAG